MKILISGSSGLIGRELLACLGGRGHEVCRIVRTDAEQSDDSILWDPLHHELTPKDFEGFDVLINLSGENIASGRWTRDKKRKITESRVMGTRILCQLLSRLQSPPRLLINASAIGYYGNRGDELLPEESSPGKGFLADVCQKWEAATESAVNRGIQVVKLRTGVVLSLKGGALAKMLVPFKLGLGGIVGSGKQWVSWISIDDLIGIFLHIIGHPEIQGPINAVTPNPVRNQQFTKELGHILHRPAFVPFPAFAARFMLGEMADETLLSSTRAVPTVLIRSGYSFIFPDLEGALTHLLRKT